MRTAGIVLLSALLLGCGAEETPEVLLDVQVGDEETARDVVAALQRAGIPARTVAVLDMAPADVPQWVDPADRGWMFLCPAADDAGAGPIVAAHFEAMASASVPVPPPPEPLVLGAAGALEASRVASIQRELLRRRIQDQAVRKDPARRGDMAAVDADNKAYLKVLVMDIGWIDVERFGVDAAQAAFLIVQHSGDLPLMLAALPRIEEDVRAGRLDGQPYALLYDRTQLMCGGLQRYGTQVTQDEEGRQRVRRLEDPDRVDARRAELGLGPLAEYLAWFGSEVTIDR